MDRGAFYTREVPLPCSQAAGINVTPVLPYTYNHLQAPFGAGRESSCLPDIGLVQKLDQVLYLLREQSKETSVIRVELRSLTAVVKELQESSRSASTSSSTQSTTPPAPPRKIPTELSALVKLLHENADPSQQFSGSEPYNSVRNCDAKNYFVAHITKEYAAKFSPRRIQNTLESVHRYYESRRRLFNDSRPERRDLALQVQVESRRKERRKRLYKSRKKYLRTAKEERKWAELNHLYMSEESEASDADVINTHRLTWRSEKLNKLVRRLDERAKNSPTTHMHSFMRKERVEKSVSSSFPPDDAPKWALRPVRMDSESIVTTPARETADMMSRRQLLNSTVSIASDSA